MRLGLIGLGRIGAFHADTLNALPSVDSLVITDYLPAVAQQVSERIGAQTADSVGALLTSGIDGLVIAAGTGAHAELLTAAVEAEIPVFCEKPISGSLAESAALLSRLAGASTPVHIGYQRRFDAGFRAARDAVLSGELGWLHTLRSTTLDPAPPPAAYIATSGGLFRDCAVHDFDIIRWVTGREVVEVYAAGSNKGADFFAEANDVDTASALLTLDDGTLALVSNTRYNARGYDVRLEVHGSNDSICAGMDDHLPLRSVEPGIAFPAGTPYPAFMERFLPAYRAELEAFTEVVAGQRTSPCTLADALHAEQIAEAATRSYREHRPIRIDEVALQGASA
ncbi:myo-inositol 2-dehydrogenase / D-chiro-inositol 1-dehydrogenase [Frankineae bacterium MT45]|nr:myo-inositol 2-dehydrogenase / D-chiro-inositol 1-dehydrogenase [Frankineae bacterium MT45]